jgi:hypothetical protein
MEILWRTSHGAPQKVDILWRMELTVRHRNGQIFVAHECSCATEIILWRMDSFVRHSCCFYL